MRYEDCDRASDLRIDKTGHSLNSSSNNNNSIGRDERQIANGNCVTIKQELLHPPIPSPHLVRRYR